MKTKKNNEFTKNNENNLNVFLVPVSVVLAGVLIMVSVLVSAISIRGEVKDIKNQLALIQKNGLAGNGVAATPTATPRIYNIDEIKTAYKNQNVIRFGDENKSLLFIEISDPSCPYCHAAGGHNKELNREFGGDFILSTDGGTYVAPVPEMKKLVDEGKASFLWMYSNGHNNGKVAAQALYCAHEKGKFWPVHDLFMNAAGYSLINDQVKNDFTKAGLLAEFVKSVIDPAELKACIESKKYEDELTRDQALASNLDSAATPGFFVNTTNFSGAYSFKEMESAVNTALGR